MKFDHISIGVPDAQTYVIDPGNLFHSAVYHLDDC
jgi:hypothetical protein